jgi:hypothetical protein
MSGPEMDRFNASVWLVDRHVNEGRGAAVAFRCGDQELTYQELQRSVWVTANGLRSLGVREGERILMVVDDELGFPAFFLAGLRIGAVPVPVSTMLRPEELAVLAVDSGATVVVISDRYVSRGADGTRTGERRGFGGGPIAGGRNQGPPVDVVRRADRSTRRSHGRCDTGAVAVHLRHDWNTEGSDPPPRQPEGDLRHLWTVRARNRAG